MDETTGVKTVDLRIKSFGMAQFPIEEFPVRHGFSTMSSGNMSDRFGTGEAEANRRRFLAFFDLCLQAVVTMAPEHRDHIKVVGAIDMSEKVECDALITRRHGVGLALLPADCFPVIIRGSDNQMRTCLALVHSGLKGTRLGIVAKTIQKMEKLGITTSSMKIAVGPGIGPCCYEGTDLASEIVEQAIEEGIQESNIVITNYCTYCSKDSHSKSLFFSHSRAMREKEREGRFMAFASL